MRRLRQSGSLLKTCRHRLYPLKLHFEYLAAGLRKAAGLERVPAYWHRGEQRANWGDALNPFLIRAISGVPVQFTRHPRLLKYLVVGSIVHAADANTVVWGAGAIDSAVRIGCRPRRVCAVRGPLTRELLRAQDVDVPEVYGDPALLMPRFYNPEVQVRYDAGLVPHYVDKGHPWLRQYEDDDRILIIDVEGDTFSFIRKLRQCRHIISSSLHGIICADAYGVPATWVEFSDDVIGDGFKFRDYFASIQRTDYTRLRIGARTTVQSLMEQHVPYKVTIDLDALYHACPFRP